MQGIRSSRSAVKAALTTTALIASLLGSMAGSATAESRPVPSAHEYISWLEESETPGADQTAAEFKALSRQDQKKFLSYLTDPASLQALAEAAAGVGPQTVTLGNGDVVIETEGASERSLGTLGTAGDWHCWYRVKQSVLGVTITRLNLDQWYHSTSTKVDRVYSAKATKTNYNIGVSISHGIERQWISSAGNALAYVDWEGSIVYEGFGVSIDKLQHSRCDETGFRYGYLKNV